MMHDLYDLDSRQKVRYASESSNTSGYSTASGTVLGNGGNLSPASNVFSTPPSPAPQSPSTLLQAELSNLKMSSASLPVLQAQNYGIQMPNTMVCIGGNIAQNNQTSPYMNFQNFSIQQQHSMMSSQNAPQIKSEPLLAAKLRINVNPVEKFRFRYKSEMHGTHGSLNGANSARATKTFPEVELCNYNGPAVIRCSLFQTNLDSPHSHQLVVRKDDIDMCDPHDLNVSREQGYIAQFQNMGIIHTAKKYIFEELLKKKQNRLLFELGRNELSTKQIQELHKQTEREAKDMNLNQVRLCFEAFKVENDIIWTRIAEPVYTNAINNRKSAQTGELRICRLSIATGSVLGGDDLILLVEKVSKKNIRVRFFELNADDEVTWEAWGKFRESDVHHQYAIVCQTPPYRNKDIDKPVDVFIELMRPSDDERSEPAITFRYKPRDAIASRKRRRTCSTATSNSSNSGSLSSVELPKTVVQEQIKTDCNQPSISEEYDKSAIINSEEFNKLLRDNSFVLSAMCEEDINLEIWNGISGKTSLQTDGSAPAPSSNKTDLLHKAALHHSTSNLNRQILKILQISAAPNATQTEEHLRAKSDLIANLYSEYAEQNKDGNSILHEAISNNDMTMFSRFCNVLIKYKLTGLLNDVVNAQGESVLYYACLLERPKYILPLLFMGCDPNIVERRYGNTALHVSLEEQHMECIKTFLQVYEKQITNNTLGKQLKANLTKLNDAGETPLHVAVRRKDYKTALELIKYNQSAALVGQSKDGNNFLHMAVQICNIDLVKNILNTCSNSSEGKSFDFVTDLLMKRNAAGNSPIDMARNIPNKIGKDILECLMASCQAVNAQMQIKEEDMSSLSSDEDETESELKIVTEDDSNNSVDIPVGDALRIKNEDDIVISDYEEGEPEFFDGITLEHLFLDKQKVQEVAKMLNCNYKWKDLARKLKLDHYICIWSDAENMLNYIQDHIDNVDSKTFIKSLSEVDKAALHLLQFE